IAAPTQFAPRTPPLEGSDAGQQNPIGKEPLNHMQEAISQHRIPASADLLALIQREPVVQMCIARLRKWKTPPNWYWADWLAELTQVFLLAILWCTGPGQFLSGSAQEVCRHALSQARKRHRQ